MKRVLEILEKVAMMVLGYIPLLVDFSAAGVPSQFLKFVLTYHRAEHVGLVRG